MTIEDVNRYDAAMHAVQSGIATITQKFGGQTKVTLG
jgi:hypothetical protein